MDSFDSNQYDSRANPNSTDPTEGCVICVKSKFKKGVSSSRGVMVIRPRYVAFIAASPFTNDISDVAFMGNTTSNYKIDDKPIDSVVTSVWENAPAEFDSFVEDLICEIGGVIWRPEQTQIEFEQQRVYFVGGPCRMLNVRKLSDEELTKVERIVGGWQLAYTGESPPEYNSKRLDQTGLKARKEHECIGCGCRYGYSFDITTYTTRKEKGTEKKLKWKLKNYVEVHACPQCEMIQPEMVGPKRAKRHLYAIFGTLAFLAFGPLMIGMTFCFNGPAQTIETFGEGQKWLMSIGSWGALPITILLLTIQYRIAHWIPRPVSTLGDPAHAAYGVESRNVMTSTPWEEPTLSPNFIFVIGCVGAVGLLVAEIDRMISRSPTNSMCVPHVVGINDTIYVDFPTPRPLRYENASFITRAELLNADALGLDEQQAVFKTKDFYWTAPRSEDNLELAWWVEIEIPSHQSLRGKAIELRVNLTERNPLGLSFEKAIPIKLSTKARAGIRYLYLWWGGLIACALITLVAGFLFHRNAVQLGRRGNPVKIEDLQEL